MEKTKEEKEELGVSWPLLFAVTGCSLIVFSFVMKFLEGKQNKLMLWGGIIALIAAVIAQLGKKPDIKINPQDENEL